MKDILSFQNLLVAIVAAMGAWILGRPKTKAEVKNLESDNTIKSSKFWQEQYDKATAMFHEKDAKVTELTNKLLERDSADKKFRDQIILLEKTVEELRIKISQLSAKIK